MGDKPFRAGVYQSRTVEEDGKERYAVMYGEDYTRHKAGGVTGDFKTREEAFKYFRKKIKKEAWEEKIGVEITRDNLEVMKDSTVIDAIGDVEEYLGTETLDKFFGGAKA